MLHNFCRIFVPFCVDFNCLIVPSQVSGPNGDGKALLEFLQKPASPSQDDAVAQLIDYSVASRQVLDRIHEVGRETIQNIDLFGFFWCFLSSMPFPGMT